MAKTYRVTITPLDRDVTDAPPVLYVSARNPTRAVSEAVVMLRLRGFDPRGFDLKVRGVVKTP